MTSSVRLRSAAPHAVSASNWARITPGKAPSLTGGVHQRPPICTNTELRPPSSRRPSRVKKRLSKPPARSVSYSSRKRSTFNWLLEYHAMDLFRRNRIYVGLTTRRGN